MNAKRWIWPVAIGLVFLCAAWSCGLVGSREVGKTIQELGLTDSDTVRFTWAPSERQPIIDYCRETGGNVAHFSGAIMLSRPDSDHDGVTIGLADGKLSHYFSEGDPEVDADIARLRAGNLREMLKDTKNDWRIYNDNNHFIDPSGSFTGEVRLYPAGWLGTMKVLQVRKDQVVGSRRSMYLTLD